MVVQVPRSDVRRKATQHEAALLPYIGGKRRIVPLIFREIDNIIRRENWGRLTFLDAFMGGGSVSLYAKAQGFSVVSCDIAERCLIVGRALVANNRVKLRREDVLRVTVDNGHPPGPVETTYVPKVFMTKQARLFDRILWAAAEAKDPVLGDLYRLLGIRAMLNTQPMSRPRSGTIDRLADGEYESITESCLNQYVSGMKLTRSDRMQELAATINTGVFAGSGRVVAGDSFESVKTIPADVAYFDPPYPGTQSYEKYYYILDEIFEGQKKDANPVSGKDGGKMIEDLLSDAVRFPIYVLSLNNAVMDAMKLEEVSTAAGRLSKVIEFPYRHSANMETEAERGDHREIIVVSWNPEAVAKLTGGNDGAR